MKELEVGEKTQKSTAIINERPKKTAFFTLFNNILSIQIRQSAPYFKHQNKVNSVIDFVEIDILIN